MQQTIDIQQEIEKLNQQFLQSSDFTAKEIDWGQGEKAILCFYSSLVNKNEVEQNLFKIRRAQITAAFIDLNKEQTPKKTPTLDDSLTVTNERYDNQKLVEYIRKIFIRGPYYKAKKQATSFSPQKDDEV